ncbi:hypothetical protein Cni_G23623 [Canna indica]|uniref:PWWP domain-containing protein n=1 Tax=Canna indica TaxID=4628 RepID=A0AAQ3KWK3_9LILI|nr:hypothetical protein Cni_G23623 [Canna indica]
MGSDPSENKAEGGSLDLNSTASERPETLPEVCVKEAEKVGEVDTEHDDSEKKDVGDAKAVVETGDGEDAADGAVADASEVKTTVEVETGLADTDVVDNKSMEEIGSTIGSETCGGSGGDQDARVGEQGTFAKRKRGRSRKSAAAHSEKTVFTASDLVWGKVRSHPWWPAQILDPSDASEMASSVRKKDHYLVAYFGDNTFAWCDESQLKPFQMHFLQMEKQNSMNAFVTAVDTALQEVSRRVRLGMTCNCFMDETYASLMDQKFENTGVQEGKPSYAVDRSSIVSSFDPFNLINYIQTLAEFPYREVDRLELAITKSQLSAFYHSKGYSELPEFVLGKGLKNNIEGSPIEEKNSDKEVVDPSSPTSSHNASRKGKSRVKGSSVGKEKHIVEHGKKRKSLSDLMEKEDAGDKKSSYGGNTSSHPSHKKEEFDNFDVVASGKEKKKKLDSLGDLLNKSNTSNANKKSKFGELMRRVAGQLTGSTHAKV